MFMASMITENCHDAGWKPSVSSSVVAPAMTTTYPRATGSMNFHPSAMSWSYRNRGSVQRTQMNTKTKNSVLAQMKPNVTSVLRSVCGATLSHRVNGMSHPPKNSVDMSALAVITFAYSAMKNME